MLHSHLGMRGSWRLYRPGERWRAPAASAWIELATERRTAVNFNGTSMRIVREAELPRDPRLARLGPDLLDPAVTDEAAAGALRAADPQLELGEALLDQSVAGWRRQRAEERGLLRGEARSLAPAGRAGSR